MQSVSQPLCAFRYTNYTHVPSGVPIMADDDPLRTFTDYSNYPGYGPGIYSPRNPWRAAGVRIHPCSCPSIHDGLQVLRRSTALVEATAATCTDASTQTAHLRHAWSEGSHMVLMPETLTSKEISGRISRGPSGRVALWLKRHTSCTQTTEGVIVTDCASNRRI